MAQWKETLEPYVRVQEVVKTATINPTAGEDLIIGCTIISDAGPSVPTLITSQKEFLNTYSSRDLSKEYVDSLNSLYSGDDKTLAATMWANAYRLAGSNTLLVTRASSASDITFVKPLVKNSLDTYILRDGELLKKVDPFKLVICDDEDSRDTLRDGWSINVNGVGIIGNTNTDEGAQYDYYVQTLVDLVEQLNETPKFYSPNYTFYSTVEARTQDKIEDPSTSGDIKAVVFNEVYLAAHFLDTTDIVRSSETGMVYLHTCDPESDGSHLNQNTVLLNEVTNFEPVPYYAKNYFNSASELKVRIRRFNHDAVVSKVLAEGSTTPSTLRAGKSPYTVLTKILDTFTQKGTKEPAQAILDRDFFEVAVFDPSIAGEVMFFNVGNIAGRGDITVAELNNNLNMIKLELPDDLHDLKLNYYNYPKDDFDWFKVEVTDIPEETLMKFSEPNFNNSHTLNFLEDLENKPKVLDEIYRYAAKDKDGNPIFDPVKRVVELNAENILKFPEQLGGKKPTYMQDYDLIEVDGKMVKDLLFQKSEATGELILDENGNPIPKIKMNEETNEPMYELIEIIDPVQRFDYFIYKINGDAEIYADLTIDPTKYSILRISDAKLKAALDLIDLNEVYTVEGLSDLGNTEPSFQSYMANMAINSNYFYPISTVDSTNYMTIGNAASKLSQNSYKLYMSSPWDNDTTTLGWAYHASPSVLYWECVSRNRRNNEEFRGILGQTGGIMQYQNPLAQFNKKTRQLLLSKKVNTVLWNVSTNAWNMNDNYTKQSEDTIMSDEGNSRLGIRISKSMPTLLKQFIGRKISTRLCSDVYDVIDYFFKSVILPMSYTVDGYQIFCDYDENLARQNKIKVVVNVRFSRSLKYIEVVNQFFDVGMDISSSEA